MLTVKYGQIFSKVPFSHYRISWFSLKSGFSKDISKILCVSTNVKQHNCVQTRTLLTPGGNKFKPLYNRDNVDKNCELIYNFGMSYRYITMGFHAMAVPLIGYGVFNLIVNYDTLKDLTFMHIEMLPHMNAMFCFCVMIYTNRIMRQYMYRIYYDPQRDIYIGIHPRWTFKMQKLEFKPEDCDQNFRNPTSGMWPGNIRIKNQRFSITDTNFKYATHFERIFKRKVIEDEESKEMTEVLKFGTDKIKRAEDIIKKKIDLLKKMMKKKQ